jgi:Tfp pilus assembly protein PilF
MRAVLVRCLLALAGGLPLAGCQVLPTVSPGPTPPAESTAQAVKAGLELPPAEAGQVCLGLAQSLRERGHDTDAIIMYERARQYNPKLTHVSRTLAVLYDRQGNYERAQAEYQQALRHQPDDADLHNDLGYCHYNRGKWAEAEKHLSRAVALKPDHARAWINLGMVLGQQGRYEESLEAFARVVSPAQAQCNLAFLLTTQGKRAEARVAYRQALELDPELRLARAALAKLEQAEATAPALADGRRGPTE